MNSLILSYVLITAFILFYLTKRKMKIARNVYLFTIFTILFILLASDKTTFIAQGLTQIFGKKGYIRLYNAIHVPVVGVLSPIVIIELLIPLLFFVVCVALTVKTVEVVSNKLREEKDVYNKPRINKSIIRRSENRIKGVKIYLMNCVMRC